MGVQSKLKAVVHHQRSNDCKKMVKAFSTAVQMAAPLCFWSLVLAARVQLLCFGYLEREGLSVQTPKDGNLYMCMCICKHAHTPKQYFKQ